MARLNIESLSSLEYEHVPGVLIMSRRLFLPIVIAIVAGCTGDTPTPIPETPATPQVEQPAEGPESVTFSGHVLAADTEYYIDGPQQSRPPDGTLKAGTKVKVLEHAGSYHRVLSQDGIVAFIAADAIPSPDVEGPQAAP